LPFVATPTAHPGVVDVHFANTASTFDSTLGALWPARTIGKTAAATASTQYLAPSFFVVI